MKVVCGAYYAPVVSKLCVQSEGLLCASVPIKDEITIKAEVDDYITVENDVTFD